MTETKEFPTLVVATTATGISLGTGINYSNVQECAEWICGHPVWTHELGFGPLMDRVSALAYAMFPLLPTKDAASADWSAAARKAIEDHGETVLVPRGALERDQSPIETLKQMRPNDDPLVIVHG